VSTNLILGDTWFDIYVVGIIAKLPIKVIKSAKAKVKQRP